jgi:hypothetical protein
MKNRVIKWMIDKNYVQTNSLINATIQSHGIGGSPVILEKDLLFEKSAETPKGTVYIKGCDPENLKEYVVPSKKVHAINGMDEPTIRRLFPEMAE